MYDLIIVGGGAAGLTAGIYARRATLKTLLLEKLAVGGQINITDIIENYPGFPEISGPELMEKFKEHAEKFDLEIKIAEVKRVRDEGEKKIVITTGEEFETLSVIISSGSSPRELKVPGEKKFKGRGISYCAICDGPFFSKRKVAVVGGGDSAIKEALYLTQIVEKVIVIHRRDKLRAEKIIQEKAFSNRKMDFIWDTVVEEIVGENRVEMLKLRNVKTGEKSELAVDGVFIYIGVHPNTKFVDVKKTEGGLILTDECMETSSRGIFAAGDCRAKCLRQIATCVGEGAIAAYNAGEYVENLKSNR
ncbi:MAG: thioredoxin-disulfide reductase [Candidatus Methanofastidiosia archaeon]